MVRNQKAINVSAKGRAILTLCRGREWKKGSRASNDNHQRETFVLIRG
jgi:hypothetical protein